MDGKAPRILVVDDDPELRALLQRFLREHGFEVRVADSGRAMEAGLQREPADLLVLDLMMPGEDGLAILRRLREGGDGIPVIMLTARGDPVDRVIGLEMGADDYLGKPFLPRELVARINALLRRLGLISEIVSWKLKLYVPAGAAGADVFDALVDRFPIQRVIDRKAA